MWEDDYSYQYGSYANPMAYHYALADLEYEYNLLQQPEPAMPPMPGIRPGTPRWHCMRRCWLAYRQCLRFARTPWERRRCYMLYQACVRRCHFITTPPGPIGPIRP
jgi:hypothetical protein